MRQTSDGENRPERDGSQRFLDRVVSGSLLLVLVTVVLLYGANTPTNTAPVLTGLADNVAMVAPDDPGAEPPPAILRGGDNQRVQVLPAPQLSPAELATFTPNELGHIPVLMYHAFTTNPSSLDQWTVTPEIFRQHLQWLYDRDFYVTPLIDVITNEISVPPGKHPVVLTFDDSSSGQFRLLEDDRGGFSPDPVTAVGVMEAFFREHPDFGRGGFFAVVPVTCFSHDDEVTTCEERLSWLAAHGYEIGNHTWWHQNLGDVSDETLMAQIGDTKLWLDDRVAEHANRSTVLVLPFGEYPGYPWQFDMLVTGFPWEGQTIGMTGILAVNGGPSVSPSSVAWDPWAIARVNTDDQTLGYWQAQIDAGAMTLYTSDGNPASIAVPDVLPEDLVDQFDAELIAGQGRSVLRYDAAPADERLNVPPQVAVLGIGRESRFTRSRRPSQTRSLEAHSPSVSLRLVLRPGRVHDGPGCSFGGLGDAT